MTSEPLNKRQKVNPITNETSTGSNAFLETINPEVLNFDYEKLCLISLSNVNVYCCLVCGKYFQGRSKSSHAYMHSVNSDHHVYINMQTLKLYVLPDGTEIIHDSKLIEDIRYLINPTYTIKDIVKLDEGSIAFDIDNNKYIPGFVGLNEGGKSYVNAIIQAVGHVKPIRDYFLLKSEGEARSELTNKFGLIIRKLWSSRLFRNHLSAHEFIKEIPSDTSSTPKKFLVWLLNQLHIQISTYSGYKKTVFSKSFQGKVEIITTPLISSVDNENRVQSVPDVSKTHVATLKYWILTLDLPPTTSQTSESDEIAQVSIQSLLSKYDGVNTKQTSNKELKYLKLIDSPNYLIMHIDRNLEKKQSLLLLLKHIPTVVTYPLALDMSPYIKDASGPIQYELVSNVKHKLIPGVELDHTSDKHQWSTRVQKNDTEWLNIHDLSVEPCERELMFLDESYLLIWKKSSTKSKTKK